MDAGPGGRENRQESKSATAISDGYRIRERELSIPVESDRRFRPNVTGCSGGT